MLDALVIAPHPDDAELGMGGTIALMLARGMRVGVLDLTDGEPTPRGSKETRARETAAATAALGIPWRENLGLPNRRLRATLAALPQLPTAHKEATARMVLRLQRDFISGAASDELLARVYVQEILLHLLAGVLRGGSLEIDPAVMARNLAAAGLGGDAGEAAAMVARALSKED
jgi:hypothetical protein